MEKVNLGWQEVRASLPSKSSHSKHLIAENSGHIVTYEQPEIIVEAVREMIEELNCNK
jgi:pimeloyl-ACP methyl ester carboxylesterase